MSSLKIVSGSCRAGQTNSRPDANHSANVLHLLYMSFLGWLSREKMVDLHTSCILAILLSGLSAQLIQEFHLLVLTLACLLFQLLALLSSNFTYILKLDSIYCVILWRYIFVKLFFFSNELTRLLELNCELDRASC